jgi:hypothetical protein
MMVTVSTALQSKLAAGERRVKLNLQTAIFVHLHSD